MIRVAIRWSFSILDVSSVSLVLKWKVSFTDLYTSQERFSLPTWFYVPSASSVGNTARTRWFLRLLSFLKPIISTFVKIYFVNSTFIVNDILRSSHARVFHFIYIYIYIYIKWILQNSTLAHWKQQFVTVNHMLKSKSITKPLRWLLGGNIDFHDFLYYAQELSNFSIKNHL